MLFFSRAHRFLILFCSLCLLPLSLASSLDVICDSVQQLGECQARIDVPTLALKFCSQDFFKVDPCKTKFRGRYPCGISWRGVKFCDGWTCSPGTVKTVIQVPCGVDVGSKSLNLCDMARQTVPAINELTRQAVGYCKCLPKVLDFVDLDTVKSLVSSLDIGDASADVLQKYGDAQVCMIDNGFNIQDNKQDLSVNSGALVQSDGQLIFTAAEIDLSRYIALAVALATCITGCDIPAIEGFFTDYLTDSEETMGQQIQDFLTPWQTAFSGVKDGFDQLGIDMSQIQTQLGEIGTSVEKIANDFCSNFTDCAGTTVDRLQTQVKDTIDSSQALIGLQTELTTALTDTQQLYEIVSDAITAFDTLADLGIDKIVQKVIDGQLRSIQEVAETLQAAQRLPGIITDIQQIVPNVQKYVQQLQSSAPDFVRNVDTIVSDSWLSDPQGDEAAVQAAIAAVQEIQSLFTDEFMTHVSGVTASIASIITLLQAVSMSGSPSLEVRVASYQRWSTGHFSMPCLTTGKVTLSIGGYSQEFDYPKFYRCEQDYQIPFPNHHIPYVKVSFSDNSIPTLPVSLPTATSIGPDALASDFTVIVLPPPQTIAVPTDVGVDPLATSLTVALPAISDVDWPYISTPPTDAVSLQPTVAPDPIDSTATAVTLSAPAGALTPPPDVYSRTEDIPADATTTFGPSVVFFTSVNEAGETISGSTTLTGTDTFEVSATEVIESVSGTPISGLESATPQGFVTGELTAGSTPARTDAPGATATQGGAVQLERTAWTFWSICLALGALI